MGCVGAVLVRGVLVRVVFVPMPAVGAVPVRVVPVVPLVSALRRRSVRVAVPDVGVEA